MAARIADMASKCFRMICSFANWKVRRLDPACDRSNSPRAASFPKKCGRCSAWPGLFGTMKELFEGKSVSCRGTAPECYVAAPDSELAFGNQPFETSFREHPSIGPVTSLSGEALK
jgi:hypothetical protein